MDLAYPEFRNLAYSRRAWGFQRASSGFVYHCVEFTDPQDLRIAWALAVRREEGSLELEDLSVRPEFRRQGYGKRLTHALGELSAGVDEDLDFLSGF